MVAAHVAVALFDPFPTLPDTSIAAAVLMLHTDVITRMSSFSWFGCVALVAVASFMPIMRLLWLGPGSGNANFYFNMVCNILVVAVLRWCHDDEARIWPSVCAGHDIYSRVRLFVG